jgi:MFS family permease
MVAYCGDLGYGPVAGTQMLSLMLGLGIFSRIGSGFIADRIGGLATVMLGSVLQALSLTLFVGFTSMPSLYLISALFGLVQGGIVPSYAIIIREYFPAAQAGARIGLVVMATVLGMALGGWMSGEAFDLTGSYRAAFINGVMWNVLNAGIILLLIWRRRAGRGLPFDYRPSSSAR